MKKIKFLFIIISLFIITSCTIENVQNNQNKNEYLISYFINGDEVFLQPDKYVEGIGCNLPTPEIEDGYIFLGWYNNYNYEGAEISSISTTDTGHKTLFGKTEAINNNEKPNNDVLENALKIKNYSFSYKEIYSDYEYSETYKVTSNALENTYEYFGDYYTEYLDMRTDEYRIVYEDQNKWYYTLENDEYYDMLIEYYLILQLDKINVNNFIYDEVAKCFLVKNDALKNEVSNILGSDNNDDFISLKIYLDNDTLSKIEILATYSDDGFVDNVTYEFVFSNISTTFINIPEAIYDNNFEELNTKIKDVYNLDINDVVSIEGIVTGIYGNNFYLTDETGSILIYMGSSNEYSMFVDDGNILSITGTISSYKDIYQITNVTSISTSFNDIEINSINMNNLSQSNLEKFIGDLVNIENAVIKQLPKTQTLSSDISFKIELNNNEVDVFISKHLEDTYTLELLTYINSLQVGDIFNLNNLHVGKYNAYQLIVTTITTFEDIENVDSYQVGIVTYPTTITVEQGITIDEIYGMISVYAKYSNNKVVLLETSTYIKETDFKDEVGTYEITYYQQEFTTIVQVIVVDKGTGYIKPKLSEQPLRDEANKNGFTRGLPSVGEPKVLVIPVEFKDYPAPSNMVDSLNKAFFGKSEDTGWESLQSYYYKSSYGKLNITGTVLQPYNTGKKSTAYTYDAYADYDIIKAALEYYDDVIDYSDYDTDKDGYIDSIYIVYTRTYDDYSDLWWAYTYEYFTETEEYYDNVEADFYSFISYQFFFDKLNDKKITYNCETLIHETGHLLGLDDYYDYEEGIGPDGGIGGGDMMDYNVGDHNAYSKLILGWITPYVLTGTTLTIDLNSFEKSGDCIMICKNWNGSVFSEYYIIDFYTPTGLNQFCSDLNGLFSIYGVRIYHVDSTIELNNDDTSLWDMTKYNNSDTAHRLIRLVEADGKNNIDDMGYSENSDLFVEGNVCSNLKWYDNTSVKFTITVNEITTSKANITIKFN